MKFKFYPSIKRWISSHGGDCIVISLVWGNGYPKQPWFLLGRKNPYRDFPLLNTFRFLKGFPWTAHGNHACITVNLYRKQVVIAVWTKFIKVTVLVENICVRHHLLWITKLCECLWVDSHPHNSNKWEPENHILLNTYNIHTVFQCLFLENIHICLHYSYKTV